MKDSNTPHLSTSAGGSLEAAVDRVADLLVTCDDETRYQVSLEIAIRAIEVAALTLDGEDAERSSTLLRMARDIEAMAAPHRE
ncbi:hypothetical protein OG2516_05258 [Oceanicola granulosus HTCC2516]|uniref:Uncharacterized protein n=1 Tax=Oceanicola granulosus (strain ATCC BAA-861 / DSM 15982 / KCTC 12143 / HTCC2516) TaxID=314256 RepID=Q2CIV0_OCEGH|nr:hypothetical protein [Oceanicola granulosus]EAR52489.1 hypothetical protein OG2516_05258 [Oceanicola granulosus HTCC2516]